MSKPSICKGCLWPPAEGKSEILQMDKKELSITKLSFLAKIQCTGNSPAKWVELGRSANMHIFTQNNQANIETSRGTNYLLSFLP